LRVGHAAFPPLRLLFDRRNRLATAATINPNATNLMVARLGLQPC